MEDPVDLPSENAGFEDLSCSLYTCKYVILTSQVLWLQTGWGFFFSFFFPHRGGCHRQPDGSELVC